MKIKNNTPKKHIIVVTSIVLALIIGSVTLAYTEEFGPFADETSSKEYKQTNTSNDHQNKNTDQVTKEDNEPGTPPVNDTDYISTPITIPPTTEDPYPIENEHYKISQNSDTSFHITLYPIANNPEYSDYNTQLRIYKQEALDYLQKRYGNITNFEITWNPPEAENV